MKERLHYLKFVTPKNGIASQNSCSASDLESLEESLTAAVAKTLNRRLQELELGSCAVIKESISNFNSDLENSFSDLMNKLKDTDRTMNSKWEDLVNFPTAISKRMGKFESDQMQFAKSEIHNMKQVNEAESSKFKKLENRIGKIEKNIEKIFQTLIAGN